MDKNKLEAAQILDHWYKLFSYCSNDIFSVNTKDLRFIVGEKILTNKEVIKEINKQGKEVITGNDIRLFDYISNELKKDKELIIELLQTNGNNYISINNELKNDRDIVLAAIESQPKIFKYINEQFKDDDEIVNSVIYKAPENFSYVSDRLKNNREFILEVSKEYPSIVCQINPRLKSDINLLFQVWNNIKANYKNNELRLFNHTLILFTSMDKKLQPFFEALNPEKCDEILFDKIDNVFNSLILNQELTSELNSSNKQDKKIKI